MNQEKINLPLEAHVNSKKVFNEFASPFRTLLVYPNLTMMLVPSLAIGIFARILRDAHYEVALFDSTHYVAEENSSPKNRVLFLQARDFDEADDLGVRVKTDLIGDYRRKVQEFNPHVILYSVVEDCFRQTISLMESIDDLSIPHLVGGVYPTAAPEFCLENKYINAIGLGEGEQIVLDFCEAIRLAQPIHKIPGVWSKQDGKIVKVPRGPLPNINQRIPDFSLFDEARFNRPMGGSIFRTFPIESYRGCPFQCTYCNSPMQTKKARESGLGNFLRRKPIELLREEIETIVQEYHPEFLYFVDDSFTARPKIEVLEFCKMYEQFRIPFWFNTRPETTTPDMLERLRDAGAYRISFGIESGNEQYRTKVLKRKGANGELKAHFDNIAKSGIPFSLNLIIGLPGETRDLVMDTVEFTRTITGYDTVTVSIFTPYNGTVLREVAVDNGWLDAGYITKHTTSSSPLKMCDPYLSSKDIDALMRVIPLYIYFPKTEWPKIQRAEIDDEEGNQLLAYYGKIYKSDFLKENQYEEKTFAVVGGTGCRSNPKESFRVYKSPQRFTNSTLDSLIKHSTVA
jgi:anaerobic magnesium-protoporphyrin IX monomethyl ester cyclase